MRINSGKNMGAGPVFPGAQGTRGVPEISKIGPIRSRQNLLSGPATEELPTTMGPTMINGLPAHVLFVHAAVVLVPLAALLLVLCVLWPAAQRRLGAVTPVVAFVALVTVPLTSHSGEWLEHRIGHDPLVRAHAELGDQLLLWAAATFLLSMLWWATHSIRARTWLTARTERFDVVAANRAVAAVLAVVALAVSVGSVVQVYRIGDSGAKAAWQDRIAAPLPDHN